jgi:hypothetical protein
VLIRHINYPRSASAALSASILELMASQSTVTSLS